MVQSHPLVGWRSIGSQDTDQTERTSPAAHGCWMAAPELQVSIDDIGFRQSVVAVERLRTYQGRPAALAQHLIRWRRTLDQLAIAITVEEAEVASRIEQLIQQNDRWCRRVGDFGITLLATPGPLSERGACPTEIMHLNPLDHAKVHRHRTVGQPLVITDVQQPSAKCWPRDIKVRCRLHYYLADRAAAQIDPAAVGLLVDADGSVTETSVANLAICCDGVILSPPAEQVLPGITQQLVQQVAMQAGVRWRQTTLFPADVRRAQEVWLMGTDGGLWFVNQVDAVPLHGDQPGPIYRRLLREFDIVMAMATEQSDRG